MRCRRRHASEDVAVMPGLSRLQADMLERWNAEETRVASGARFETSSTTRRRASASLGVSLVASLFLAMAAFVVGARVPSAIRSR